MAQSARVGDISLPRLSTVLITVSPAAANLTMTEASRVNAAGTFDAKWVELVCSFTCKRPRESDIKDFCKTIGLSSNVPNHVGKI